MNSAELYVDWKWKCIPALGRLWASTNPPTNYEGQRHVDPAPAQRQDWSWIQPLSWSSNVAKLLHAQWLSNLFHLSTAGIAG